MTIVVLAAGRAHRMGCQKLFLPIDGRPMIERVLQAAAAWPTVIVAGDDVACALGSSDLRIVRNATPERGMTHSLALANQVVAADEPIAILLGDLPDITPLAIAGVVAAYDNDVDVIIPCCGETFGHPVVFGPLARRKIPNLPDGDTIHRLRDDPALRRRVVPAGTGTLADIDTPADYSQRTGQPRDPVETSP